MIFTLKDHKYLAFSYIKIPSNDNIQNLFYGHASYNIYNQFHFKIQNVFWDSRNNLATRNKCHFETTVIMKTEKSSRTTCIINIRTSSKIRNKRNNVEYFPNPHGTHYSFIPWNLLPLITTHGCQHCFFMTFSERRRKLQEEMRCAYSKACVILFEIL